MKGKPPTASLVKLLLVLLIGALVLSVGILAWTPPISRDALTHHLAVPKLYLRHGGIYEIPFMPFSYFPMNVDLLYLVSLYFGSDILPKYIHFSFALLTAWLIFNYLRPRTSIIYAILAVLFFLSSPIIVKLSITVYVDLGLVFFTTASLLLLLKWVERGLEHRFLALSAVCCGLAMGIKYNGLIAFFLLTLFVPFLHSRYAEDKKAGAVQSLRYGAFFFALVLLLFAPWMIRNYIWTGNPLSPLYDRWFNPEDPVHWHTIDLFTFRSAVYQEEWWQIALLPVRIFFEGQDGSPQYFDGRLNPFLLFLPPFALYRIGKESDIMRMELKAMLSFSVLFFAFAFFSDSLRVRYISPIIPPLVMLSVFGLRKIVFLVKALRIRSLRNIGLTGVALLMCFAFWLNFRYIVNQYRYIDPFSYLGGTVTRDEYIERHRPEYPAMQYIKENLPPGARILFLFMGNRGYYCDREYIFDMNHNRSMLKSMVAVSRSTDDLLLRIQGRGITHLLIHYPIFDRWIQDTFTEEEQGFLREFLQKHVRLLYFKAGYGLLRLADLR